MRLTGKAKVHNKSNYTALYDVSKIERIEAPKFDYSKLDAPVYDNSKADSLDEKMITVTGTLDAGMFLNSYDNAYSLTLKGVKLGQREYLFCNVIIGSGPSQMEPVGENFSNKTIKIRDNQGNLFPIGKKVKVYGVFNKSSSNNGGSIYVEEIIVQ